MLRAIARALRTKGCALSRLRSAGSAFKAAARRDRNFDRLPPSPVECCEKRDCECRQMFGETQDAVGHAIVAALDAVENFGARPALIDVDAHRRGVPHAMQVLAAER